MALSALHSQKIFLLESTQWIVKSSPGIGEKLMKVHKEGMVKHPSIATAERLLNIALKEQRS